MFYQQLNSESHSRAGGSTSSTTPPRLPQTIHSTLGARKPRVGPVISSPSGIGRLTPVPPPGPTSIPSCTTTPQTPGPADSFVVLSESTLGAARAAPQSNTPTTSRPMTSTIVKKEIPAASNRSSQHQIERLLKLCALLSPDPAPAVEHPLCTECTDLLLELMSNQLQDAKSDRDRYAVFERDLNRERAGVATGAEGSESCEAIREDIENVSMKAFFSFFFGSVGKIVQFRWRQRSWWKRKICFRLDDS